jgi:hypothetical protein
MKHDRLAPRDRDRPRVFERLKNTGFSFKKQEIACGDKL